MFCTGSMYSAFEASSGLLAPCSFKTSVLILFDRIPSNLFLEGMIGSDLVQLPKLFKLNNSRSSCSSEKAGLRSWWPVHRRTKEEEEENYCNYQELWCPSRLLDYQEQQDFGDWVALSVTWLSLWLIVVALVLVVVWTHLPIYCFDFEYWRRLDIASGSSTLTPIRPIACLSGILDMKDGIVKLA